jgi:hypothetical protein
MAGWIGERVRERFLMFKIFNPLTGMYADAENETSAKDLWANTVAMTAAHFTSVPVVQGRYRYDPDWAADFDTAYAFYCTKHEIAVTDVLASMGLSTLTYAHSVFNTTTGERWSNTFAYVDDSGKIFHIKVHNSQVTDWYVQKGEIDGQVYEWVAFDLSTGQPIEVYEQTSPGTLQKRNLADSTAATVETHFMPLSEMPSQVIEAVADLPYKETITAYSEKTYGLIVEYAPPYVVPEEQWPSDIRFELANQREQALFNARVKARDLVTVVEVTTDELGQETWTNHGFAD